MKPLDFTVKLEYSNGLKRYQKFKSIMELRRFIHNEGDHLISYKVVDKPV